MGEETPPVSPTPGAGSDNTRQTATCCPAWTRGFDCGDAGCIDCASERVPHPDHSRERPGCGNEGWGRVALLAEWIERDRGERDRVLAYAMELANLATAHGGRDA